MGNSCSCCAHRRAQPQVTIEDDPKVEQLDLLQSMGPELVDLMANHFELSALGKLQKQLEDKIVNQERKKGKAAHSKMTMREMANEIIKMEDLKDIRTEYVKTQNLFKAVMRKNIEYKKQIDRQRDYSQYLVVLSIVSMILLTYGIAVTVLHQYRCGFCQSECTSALINHYRICSRCSESGRGQLYTCAVLCHSLTHS